MMPASLEVVTRLSADAGCWSPPLEPTRVRYFKRYRMEIDLNGLATFQLPEGYAFLGWHPTLLNAHAEALYDSFFQGVDTAIFPSLGDRAGCRNLMAEIVRRPGFEPGATWLLMHGDQHAGTIQGIRERSGTG